MLITTLSNNFDNHTMNLLLPLIAIVTGMLAAASVVIKKSPDAASLIKKIKPYEAFIGAASLIMGILSLLNVTTYFRYSFIYGSISSACIASCIIMGFLLGYPVIQDFLLDELSEEARAKSNEIYERLTPYKITSGLVAMATGGYLVITSLLL